MPAEQPDLETQVFGSLCAELDTHWLPDPWGWRDLPTRGWSDDDLRSESDTIQVPLIGKPSRAVPLLDESSQTMLMRRVLEFLVSEDSRLAPGVAGYRLDATGCISHYREGLRRRAEIGSTEGCNASQVLLLDLKQFFPSVRARTIADAIGRDPANYGELFDMLAELEVRYGYALPEGYAAARALANHVLRPGDEALGDIPFTRWVDDYQVFLRTTDPAPTEVTLAVADALSELGLNLAEGKTRVMDSRTSAMEQPVSITHSDPAVLGRPLDDKLLADERMLRHYLRIAIDSNDSESIDRLKPYATSMPASALPRLTAVIARFPAQPATCAIVSALLDIEDDLAAWRIGRLAYAVWYLESEESKDLAIELWKRAAQFPVTHAIALRALARKAPREALLGLRQARLSHRAEALLREDIAATSRVGPPVQSFL